MATATLMPKDNSKSNGSGTLVWSLSSRLKFFYAVAVYVDKVKSVKLSNDCFQ